MRRNYPVLIFILKIWTLTQNLTGSNQVQDAPIIDPFESVIIDVNQDRIIDCKAKAPITWVFDTSEKLHDSIKITHSEDDQGNHHSYLELNAVQADFVGFYYCVFSGSLSSDMSFDYQEQIKNYEASSLYVYIKDPDNKLYNPDQYILFGKQNEQLIIPCKPTSPEVKVELVKDGDEGHIAGKYDPKIGFTVSFLDDEESGFFECRVEDDHETYNEFQVIINGQATSDYVKKPWIISDSQNIAKNGAFFSLSCHVEMVSDAPYVIEFLLPNGKEAKNTDNLLLSEIKVEDDDNRKSYRNLTVNNALDSRDQGNYTCSLKDIYNNIYSTVTRITFVDKPVVQLNSSNPTVTTTKGQKSVKFHFNYFIYPKAKFEWYDPQKKLVNNDHGVQKDAKYNISISEDETSLTIKYPGIEDFGEYTLVAYTDGERFEKKVKLVVSEKPTCKMEDSYAIQGEEIYMKCECMAYPVAEIIWLFQPCQNLTYWPHCFISGIDEPKNEQNQNETQSTHDAEYIQSSEIRFTATQPGTVKCRAKNNIGEDKIEAKVQIVDLSAPLLVSGIDEDQNIAIGDKVTLECGAIIYNFTDRIRWLKHEIAVEERSDLHIKDSNTRFSYRKSLTFDTIKKEDEGEYKCEVYDKEKNELHSVAILVNLHENEPPMIITNFKQQNLSEYSGNSLTLKCLASGFPVPSLSWYKNGESFEMRENDTRISLADKDMTLTFIELKSEDSGYYECIAENSFGKETKAIEISIKLPDFQIDLNLILIISGVVVLIILLLCIIALCCLHQCKKKGLSQETNN